MSNQSLTIDTPLQDAIAELARERLISYLIERGNTVTEIAHIIAAEPPSAQREQFSRQLINVFVTQNHRPSHPEILDILYPELEGKWVFITVNTGTKYEHFAVPLDFSRKNISDVVETKFGRDKGNIRFIWIDTYTQV